MGPTIWNISLVCQLRSPPFSWAANDTQMIYGVVEAPLKLFKTFFLCLETQFSQGFHSKVGNDLSNQLLTIVLKAV